MLAVLQPHDALGSDGFGPLAEIFVTLRNSPAALIGWDEQRRNYFASHPDRVEAYNTIRAA